MAFSFKTAVFALLASLPALAVPLNARALDDAQKKEFGAFIRQYLIDNPEIMLDMRDALERKQSAARAAEAATTIVADKDAIFNSKYDLTLGNPKGDVTLVEFFDYNCGYCKRAMGDLDNILKADKNLRLVLKEFPILGPDSVAAHKVSGAVKRIAPEKYPQFQRALLGGKGRANEDSAMALAVSLGLTETDIRKAMSDPSGDASVEEAYRLAAGLGINGTPSYVIGNEVVFGAVGMAAFKEKIANMRLCGKTVCS